MNHHARNFPNANLPSLCTPRAHTTNSPESWGRKCKSIRGKLPGPRSSRRFRWKMQIAFRTSEVSRERLICIRLSKYSAAAPLGNFIGKPFVFLMLNRFNLNEINMDIRDGGISHYMPRSVSAVLLESRRGSAIINVLMFHYNWSRLKNGIVWPIFEWYNSYKRAVSEDSKSVHNVLGRIKYFAFFPKHYFRNGPQIRI